MSIYEISAEESAAPSLNEDTVFYEVPLPRNTLHALHQVAETRHWTPLQVLRDIVLRYRRNGNAPSTPGSSSDEWISRGVPLTHRMQQVVNEMAAEQRREPVQILQGIVADEITKISSSH